MSRFDAFLDLLRGYASLSCIEGERENCTYARLLDEYARWQQQLDQMSVVPGAVVGVRADYSVSATALLLALFARRAIAALIPRDRDAATYLADARANDFLELDLRGNARHEKLKAPAAHPLLEGLRARGDGGVVIFTSGSTGRPKAALQSLERFLYKFRKPRRRFRTLAFLLLDHIAGLDTLFYTLSSGGTLVIAERRDPDSVGRLIESHGVEVLPASPSFLRLLCLTADGHRNYSSLKIITYGSEPMDPNTLARVNERFPNVQISQKYGTTETGSPRSESRSNDSLWLRIKTDGVETKVVEGVLWVRSEGTILGYLNAPSPVDEEGWYCTGDLVDVDGEWIRFRGRASDVINVGGEKVSPAEVEQTILELDFVRGAVVAGERHVLMGQIVTARITLARPLDTKEAARLIRAHCRSRLSSYKVPVKIEIVDEGLVNERQKARRTQATD